MPKEEWGVKRVCPSCAVRFYDLQRDPLTCPSCDEEFSLDSLTQSKGKVAAADKASMPKKEAKAEAPADDDSDDEVVLDDADDTDEASAADIDSTLLDDDDDEEDKASIEEIADVPASDDDN